MAARTHACPPPRRRGSDARQRLIVALDATALAPALRLARALRGSARTVKVGSALFTACGPEAVRRLRALGFAVMLDLKFLDIPSTVALSCRSAAGLGVALLTVHASGGRAMLEAAVRGAREGAWRSARPGVLAVTVLTSDAGGSSAERVMALANGAVNAGCDGLVASAQEAAALRRRFGPRLRIACPGIRPSGGAGDDQRRTAAPGEALRAGADWLVIGRPITAARDPRTAAEAILHDMEDALAC